MQDLYGKTASKLGCFKFTVCKECKNTDNKFYTDMLYMLECIEEDDVAYGNTSL